MTLLRLPARLAALATAVALIVSCDSRNPVAPCSGPDCSGTVTNPVDNSDNTAPSLKVALATGATAADTIVYIGGNLGVNITSADAKGVSTLSTVLRTPTTSGIVDSVTFVPPLLTVSRTYTIDAAGIARGDRLVITTTAKDASFNTRIDSLKVTVADTATPVVTVASKIGGSVKGLDSVDVAVTATDAAGIDSAGFRLLRVRAPGDTVVIFARSSKPSVRTTSYVLDLGFRISDTLPIGQYLLMPFSADRSGLSSRNVVPFAFQLTDATRPQVTILAPTANARLAVGDSILVRARLTDNAGLARVSFVGYSQRGDSLLGTNRTVIRYNEVVAPANGTFPLTRDTTITRYLKVATPVDSLADSLFVSATVTDISGLATTVRVKVLMTNGPKLTLVQPVPGDSLTRGDSLTISISATSAVGVQSIGFALSDSGFPTPVAQVPDSALTPPSAPTTSVTRTKVIFIPADANGVLTITPRATDVNGQPGAASPFRIAVRSGAPPVPLVHQSIPARVEIVDSLTITASGSSLRAVGYSIRDLATNALVDIAQIAASSSSFGPRAIPFRLGSNFQGAKIRVVSFAIDATGRVGYSVPTNVTVPQNIESRASFDTSLVVYGQTFSVPRAGIAGDLAVDTARGSVFVSNTAFNRLERWNAATGTFESVGVAVGSEPWGMVMQMDNDTLLVANSGGTNISKVCVNPAACGGIGEVLSKRVQTRNTIVQTVTQTRDPNTGKITLQLSAPISYSDRPQYVQQSQGGRLFYSTRPTASAPAGTIRWLDPKLEVPDPRQVYQYAEKSPDNTYAVFNADSMKVVKFEDLTKSDELIIYDHIYGKRTGGACTSPQTNGSVVTVANSICGRDSTVVEAVRKVNVQGGDVDARLDIDVEALGLSDTTFVASSGDRAWIGFGEGRGRGRVMMAQDLAGDSIPRYFSPGTSVNDLIENASEQVFGMGLDRFGSTVAVHGVQSYFATVESPFHLRLQGKYDTFDRGAGITFHPSADLRSGSVSSSKSDSTRTAFVASANGSIEVVDAAYFIARGTLQIKNNLYGPLRASLPFASDNVGIAPNDPRYIILKLFGLTTKGLVVINLRAQDIQPVP